MDKLKSCPYCGHEAKVRPRGHITCGNRFCINRQSGYDYPMWAKDDWNTRPIEDRLNALLDELEAEVSMSGMAHYERSLYVTPFLDRLDEILAKRKGGE